MAKLLEKIALAFMNHNANVDVSSNRNTTDKFRAYEESKEKKTAFSCRFEVADDEGNLSLTDANGVKVVLLAETFQKSTPYYSVKNKDRFIGTMSLNVVATEIDTKNNTVYVESSVNKDEVKGTLIRQIFSELKQDRHPRLAGFVTAVTDKRATINILGKNIYGFLNASNWQPIYTRSLKEFLKPGMYIEFEVTGAANKIKGLDYAFYLDRKNIAPDPWNDLPDFPQNTAIIIKCVDRPKGKNFWWGVSSSVPGIEILCNYSEHVSVMTNCFYKCKIKQYDKEKHVLKCVPFEVVPVGIATEENISFALNKNKEEVLYGTKENI